jgi:hypothetical protein
LLFATVLAAFLLHDGIDNFTGRDPLVSYSFVSTDHPNEDVWQGMLWL